MERHDPHARLITGDALEWWGLYKGGYDLWAADSYSHPAKMSPSLCFRIFEHLEELGLLKACDTILDPMGGIGTTNLVAALKGYASIMVELEDKFVKLAQANADRIALKGFRAPIAIVQGDARRLSQILQERGCVSVTSPPYANRLDDHGVDKDGMEGYGYNDDIYGTTPGQIGNLRDAPLKGIMSPPYLSPTAGGGLNTLPPRNNAGQSGRSPDSPSQAGAREGYGSADGQIGALPDRPLRAITSPPAFDSLTHSATKGTPTAIVRGLVGKSYGHRPQRRVGGDNLSEEAQVERERLNSETNIGLIPTMGNDGHFCPESYLEAMRLVYAEIAKVADVLVVVTKNPTRNGKLRRLDLDTITLLEATGWRIHCRHRAMLFEEQEQAHLFQGQVKKTRGRMSFFKRLSWQKGAPVAMWEDVVFCHRLAQYRLERISMPMGI